MGKRANINHSDVIYLYTHNNYSISKIARIKKVSFKTISKILIDNNIQIRHQDDTIINNFDQIKELYFNDVSLTKIGKMFGITREAISRHLKNNNIEVINKHNLVKFDDHIFDSIDTEEKAYWLGFIYADGYVSKNGNRLEIGLKGADINHLHKLRKFIKHQNKNIIINTKVKNSNVCKLCVSSKHLKQTLISYGCVPAKSLILKFPNKEIFKSDDLIKHFIRGYFDGDGCITYFKYNTNSGIKLSSLCNVISTKEFIESFQNYFDNLNIKSKIRKDKRHLHNTYGLYFYQIESRKLLKHLYENSNIYLDRKYQLAIFFKDACRSLKEFNELLSTNIGEGCDANTEITEVIKETSAS